MVSVMRKEYRVVDLLRISQTFPKMKKAVDRRGDMVYNIKDVCVRSPRLPRFGGCKAQGTQAGHPVSGGSFGLGIACGEAPHPLRHRLCKLCSYSLCGNPAVPPHRCDSVYRIPHFQGVLIPPLRHDAEFFYIFWAP